jgi:hypothetical protein
MPTANVVGKSCPLSELKVRYYNILNMFEIYTYDPQEFSDALLERVKRIQKSRTNTQYKLRGVLRHVVIVGRGRVRDCMHARIAVDDVPYIEKKPYHPGLESEINAK